MNNQLTVALSRRYFFVKRACRPTQWERMAPSPSPQRNMRITLLRSKGQAPTL